MESFGTLDDLLYWPILKRLGLDRLKNIIRAHVQPDGKLAYIVHRDDEVYRVNEDNSSVEVTELSRHEISAFLMNDKGGSHKLALSKDGQLYVWGSISSNNRPPAATMRANPRRNPRVFSVQNASPSVTGPTLVSKFGGRKIMKMACGIDHTMVLTADGEVWRWAEQQPWQIPKCRDIAAANGTSVALTNTGVVYTSGTHSGREPTGDQGPHEVPIDRPVARIAAGNAHVLALTVDGHIFTWGKNDQGQLGNNSNIGSSSPQPIDCKYENSKIAKIIDILAVKETSLAVSTDGMVYIWGECGMTQKTAQLVPKATGERSLIAVLASNGLGTYKTLVIHDSFAADMELAFDNVSLSDCHFSVKGKTIHAQKSVLKSRSEYFKTWFNGEWKESNGEITITKHSYEVYKSLLRYLSTGRLLAADADLVSLIQLAHETMHDTLIEICVEKLRYKLSVDNIVDVFVVAKTLELKSLLRNCKQFTNIYMKEIVEKEVGIRTRLMTEILEFAAKVENTETGTGGGAVGDDWATVDDSW